MTGELPVVVCSHNGRGAPTVAATRQSGSGKKGAELLDAAVYENVRRTVERLRNSEPSLMEPLRTGAVKVVGARYDLDDGSVDFFLV